MDKLQFYANQIEKVLKDRNLIKDSMPWQAWAGPEFTGCDGYIYQVDVSRLSGVKVERLHDPKVIKAITTVLGGLTVGYTNTQGLGYWIKEKKVSDLDPVDLVEFLTETPCALIVGARGSGKTTLLQHVIKSRAHRVVVLDPKNTPGKWLDTEVAGTGADYEAIADMLHGLNAEMRRRISDIRNKASFERLLVIADEWWIINKQIDGAADLLMAIVTLGREVKMDVFVGSATRTVAGLGIQGDGELRDAFEVVELSKSGNDKYSAYILSDKGRIRAQLPGPFEVKAKRLDHIDALLVKTAIIKNGGYCSIDALLSIITNELPKRYQDKLTKHYLDTRFTQWQAAGLLEPPYRNESGQWVGRRVTERLRTLAGV